MQQLPSHDEAPFFALKLIVAFCRFDVRVNDIPVLVEDVSPGRVDIELPLNLHVFTGENTLSIRLTPAQTSEQAPALTLDNPHVLCSATLVRRPFGRDDGDVVLASIVYRGGATDPFAESSPEGDSAGALQSHCAPESLVMAARSVRLSTPFSEWAWVRAPVIEASQLVLRDLVLEAQRLWITLRDRDIAAARAMLTANARDVQSAFFLPDIEEAWRVIGVDALVHNPTATLKPLNTDVTLEVFANGRLARLVDPDGESPLCFHEGDTGLDAYVAAWFCKAPTGAWTIIR